MPKRCDLHTIVVIGSGPVVIGQAAEFDYAGTQATKALKEEGYRVVLINANPASIMTSPTLADRTYVEPMTLPYVSKILEKERPCALLSTVGGQTALNLALELTTSGTLKRLNIELIGANIEAIERAENRDLFKKAMNAADLPTLRSSICHSMKEAENALGLFGLPIVLRPSFTLGGAGGGIAHNEEDFFNLVKAGLSLSPTHQILIEESVLGHHEFEFEVIRDEADNALVICAIENFDPMGVHTGDSITVAPAQTLSDVEYQILRDASLKVVRAIGVSAGGCNVQFSVDPKTGRFFVIEMNPRVSRSSALASKATGYPIAKIAAKLAVGYHLDELRNDITKKTAAFEPALDYVAVKIPVFAFEKFADQEPTLTSQMRSVGEVMALGRSFKESLQKALSSLELKAHGFSYGLGEKSDEKISAENLRQASPKRLWRIAQAFRQGMALSEVALYTNIHPWFLAKIQELIAQEEALSTMELEDLNLVHLRHLKKEGMSDARIAELLGVKERDIRMLRKHHGVMPQFKRVDTCAAEFAAHTPYLYSTYEEPFFCLEDDALVPKNACEADITGNKKVVVLGSGPIRIGQGIEFDCCATESIDGLRDLGFETIMINCNPETVSTDFDVADRLYFEPITLEHVLNVVELEKPLGVIVQLGGQTPLSIARALSDEGIRIFGTSADGIDKAEDRLRSRELFMRLGLCQPPSLTAQSVEEGLKAASILGYPLMVRPSYVLGGRAMERVHHERELRLSMTRALEASPGKPVLIDRFLDGALELDVDAIFDGESVYVAGVLQHIEEAGIHSGDSFGVLPPYDVSTAILILIDEATRKLARALNIRGLLNIQFAVKNSALYILEANPRASRTVPFLSKATGIPLAQIAARVACGEPLPKALRERDYTTFMPKHLTAVKAPVMPFAKFPKSDPLLGPEMRSTGEVMSTASCFEEAFLKGQIAAGTKLPKSGNLFVSIADQDKEALLPALRQMSEADFIIFATYGTHWFLKAHGLASERVNKVREGSPHVLDLLEGGKIHLMFNTILGATSVYDSHLFRKKALLHNIPYFTSVSAARAVAKAVSRKADDGIMQINSLQEMHEEQLIFSSDFMTPSSEWALREDLL